MNEPDKALAASLQGRSAQIVSAAGVFQALAYAAFKARAGRIAPGGIIKNGEFRDDLYYRISEVTVRIPPLRERGNDAVVIAQAILERRAREHNRPVKGFTPEAMQAIRSYP